MNLSKVNPEVLEEFLVSPSVFNLEEPLGKVLLPGTEWIFDTPGYKRNQSPVNPCFSFHLSFPWLTGVNWFQVQRRDILLPVPIDQVDPKKREETWINRSISTGRSSPLAGLMSRSTSLAVIYKKRTRTSGLLTRNDVTCRPVIRCNQGKKKREEQRNVSLVTPSPGYGPWPSGLTEKKRQEMVKAYSSIPPGKRQDRSRNRGITITWLRVPVLVSVYCWFIRGNDDWHKL